jgi:ribonuclease P protein component
MAGGTVSRTVHFVLHRAALDAAPSRPAGPDSPPKGKQALFVVQAPWIGAVVPKRWAKRAVTRNGIKRQVYNVSAAFEARLPDAAHVVRLRTSFDRELFPSAWSEALKKSVRGELLQLFEKVAAPAGKAAAPAAAVAPEKSTAA